MNNFQIHKFKYYNSNLKTNKVPSQGTHSFITTIVSQTNSITSIKLGEAINRPKVLKKIFSKFLMCLLVFNLLLHLEELRQYKWITSSILLLPQYLATILVIVVFLGWWELLEWWILFYLIRLPWIIVLSEIGNWCDELRFQESCYIAE